MDHYGASDITIRLVKIVLRMRETKGIIRFANGLLDSTAKVELYLGLDAIGME